MLATNRSMSVLLVILSAMPWRMIWLSWNSQPAVITPRVSRPITTENAITNVEIRIHGFAENNGYAVIDMMMMHVTAGTNVHGLIARMSSTMRPPFASA